ncbi:MAG: IS3 family transposase [Myxococcota bacterium]|nr:IS3 family transposase [Myxococcota bacterium]
MSERRACQVVGIARSSKRRPSGRIEEARLVKRLHELSRKYPRFGYRKIHTKLREEGFKIGRERLRLLRKREGLRVPQKQRKRRRTGTSTTEVDRALHPNHVWSYDFVADQTSDGRRLRFLTVIDEFTRECLRIETSRFLNSHDVVRVLGQLIECRGAPGVIKSDNGPELTAKHVQEWIGKRGIATKYIDPGSPWQNGHNESFNAVFRDGCLDRWAFMSVREARLIAESWQQEYNEERPHGALSMKSPAAYAAEFMEAERNAA